MAGSDQDHHHGHNHDHDHSHHHIVNTESISKAFLIGASINFLFVVIEFVYSFISQSVSLKADALHNLTDVLALVLSWFGYKLIRSKAHPEYTFGFKKASLLVAFVNSSAIFVSLFYIVYESIERFINPQAIQEMQVITIATIGVAVNLGSAFLFKNHHHDINIKSAYMHLMVDALISVAVVVSGILIKLTGYSVIDPVLAIIVVFVMAKSSWLLLKEAIQLLVAKLPRGLNLKKIEDLILSFSEVKKFHHLRIWSISSLENALIVHLVVQDGTDYQNLIIKMSEKIKHDFKIHFVTLQLEVESSVKSLDCDQ